MNLINIINRSQKETGLFFDEDNETNLLFSSLLLMELEKMTATEQITNIKKQVNSWLLTKKDNNWLFSDNLLINFIVLSSLIKHISGKALGKVLSTLTKLESQIGGPYRSSFTEIADIDIGVNVAISYFLSLNKVELPALNNLIELVIKEQNFHTNFCNNQFLIIYLISLYYKGSQKQILIEHLRLILKQKNNNFNKLLMLTSLKNLGKETNIKIKINYDCPLQAALYLNLTANKTNIIKQQNLEDKKMMNKILLEAQNRFRNLSSDLKNIALSEIKRTITNNHDKQMSLITYYFKIALGKRAKIITDDFIAKAGLANIFFWTAFIIYDDFWDEDERAIPSILPCANLYARSYTDFYNKVLIDNTEFQDFFHNLMDKLDVANTWETLYCRTEVNDSKFTIPKELPDYKNYTSKFEPASGQILGPIVLLIKSGFKLNSPEIINLTQYFKNYLIAMQINDDAHDLIEDLERGHLSTVVVMFLKDWQKNYPEQTEIDLKSDLKKIQKLFWFKTIPTACKIAIKYTQKSKTALNKIKILENPTPLENFINIAENVAKQALSEQQKSLEILKEFK